MSNKVLATAGIVLLVIVGTAVLLKQLGRARPDDGVVAAAVSKPAPKSAPSTHGSSAAPPAPLRADVPAAAPDVPDAGPVAAEEASAEEATEEPAEPWDLTLTVDAHDFFDAEVAVQSLTVAAYDEEDGPIQSFQVTPAAPETIVLDHWPNFLAFTLSIPDTTAPAAFVAMPQDAKAQGGAWTARVPISFDQMGGFGGGPGGPGGRGEGRGGGRGGWRDAIQRRPVVDGGEAVVLARAELADLTNEPLEGVRSLTLKLETTVVPFGTLEAQATNLALREGQGGQRDVTTPDSIARVYLRPAPGGGGGPFGGGPFDGGFGRGGRGGPGGPGGADGEQASPERQRQQMMRSPAYFMAANQELQERQAAIEGDSVYFYGLPPGRYAVRLVTAQGRQGISDPVTVEAGKTVRALVSLQASATLDVHVYTEKDGDRRPLEGAEVNISVPNVNRQFQATTEIEYTGLTAQVGEVTNGVTKLKTDRAGLATFGGLDEGNADLQVTHPEFGVAKKVVRLLPYEPNDVEIVLHEGKAKVVFELLGAEEVRLEEIQLRASRSDLGGGRRQDRVGQNYDNADVPLELEVDYATWDFEFSANVLVATSPTAFAFSRSIRGFEVTDPGPYEVPIHLPGFENVQIHLTRAGAPAAEVTLDVTEGRFGGDSSSARQLTTDADGLVTTTLPPAGYLALLRQDRRPRSLGEMIVEPGGANSFTFDISQQLSLLARIVDAESGEGISRVRAIVNRSDDSQPSGFRPTFGGGGRGPGGGGSDDDGSMEISNLDAGEYVLEFMRDGYKPLTSDLIELNEETALTPVTFEMEKLEASGAIEGIVQAPDGLAMSNFSITSLVDQDGLTWNVGFGRGPGGQNRDGFYALDKLPTGKYTARFTPRSWEERTMILLPHVSEPISVTDGERSVYDVVFESGGALEITALDDKGAPVPLVDLELTDSSGNVVEPIGNFGGTPMTRTGSAGTYFWTPLPVGTYAIHGTATGWSQSAPCSVLIYENGTARATLQMTK